MRPNYLPAWQTKGQSVFDLDLLLLDIGQTMNLDLKMLFITKITPLFQDYSHV